MNPQGESHSQLSEQSRFLLSGQQTGITPEVEQIASGFQGNVRDRASSILGFVNKLSMKDFDKAVFRKRTGGQIIQDGYLTGCTDAALVFTTLARASGLPTKYVETIDKKWLEEGRGTIAGHIYTQVYDSDKKEWIWVDPLGNKIDIPPPQERVVFKEGLDSWDIGITDFASLKSNFEAFRKSWLAEQHSS